jgi:hypothetical protein
MTQDKMRETLEYYDEYIGNIGFKVNPVRENWAYGGDRLGYLRWMCQEVLSWDLEKDWEKANRWLGFIQGVLWEQHIFTIDDMRKHNRSEE